MNVIGQFVNDSVYKKFSPTNFQNYTMNNKRMQDTCKRAFLNAIDGILMDMAVAAALEDLQALRAIIHKLKGFAGLFCSENMMSQMTLLARSTHDLHRRTYLMHVNHLMADLKILINELESFQISTQNSQFESN